ncbi:Spore germination protein GerD [Dirofilaria immitis]
MAAAFIVMISLLSIFNVTKECLPNANIIDEPYPFHAGETVEVMKSFGRINDDAAAASINEVYQKNENDVKKQFEKCYTSKDCNELWKRIFGKCRCQWI